MNVRIIFVKIIGNTIIVVKDLKMKNNGIDNLHLTAWCKDTTISCLKDLSIDNLQMLLDIRNDMFKYIRETYNFSDYEVFIHYPPQFYNLHIHFRNKYLKHDSCIEEIHYLDEVIKKICNNCKL
jgi:hypothetical protein